MEHVTLTTQPWGWHPGVVFPSILFLFHYNQSSTVSCTSNIYLDSLHCCHYSPDIIILFLHGFPQLLVFLLLFLVSMIYSLYNSQSDPFKMQIESYCSFCKKKTLYWYSTMVTVLSSWSHYPHLTSPPSVLTMLWPHLDFLLFLKTMIILAFGCLPLLSLCQEHSIPNCNMTALFLSFRFQFKYQPLGEYFLTT